MELQPIRSKVGIAICDLVRITSEPISMTRNQEGKSREEMFSGISRDDTSLWAWVITCVEMTTSCLNGSLVCLEYSAKEVFSYYANHSTANEGVSLASTTNQLTSELLNESISLH